MSRDEGRGGGFAFHFLRPRCLRPLPRRGGPEHRSAARIRRRRSVQGGPGGARSGVAAPPTMLAIPMWQAVDCRTCHFSGICCLILSGRRSGLRVRPSFYS